MNIRNIRIGSRLAVGFGLAIASAAALLVLALVQQQLSSDRQADAAQRQAAGLIAESALRSSLLRSSIAIRNMGLETELAQVYKHQTEAEKQRKEYRRLLDQMDAGSTSGEVHEVVAALRANDAKIGKQYTEVVGLLGAFSTEPAVKIITEQMAPLLADADQQLARLNALTQAHAAAAVAEARQQSETMRHWVIGTGGLALVVIAVFAWRVTRSIVLPLRSAMRSADEVARGNLAFEIDDRGRDEPAQLIAAFDRMRDALSSMVGEVRESADMVAHAAHEIAQGNLDLSARTEQQASSLQQTSSTMTQLDTTVRQTAGNAAEASRSAHDATRVATAGGEAVERVVGTMREIHDSSSQIANIIGVIDGIAFQTNILALNAAVEAARAGEQGRGFAVVASEVRSLASRSSDAARQIKELISRSVERVDLGSRQVGQAGSTMNEVVDAIRRVSAIATEISAATGEQSAGVGEVGRAVAHMDEATQRNAALVEQSAAAAESLRAQSARLVETVSTFRLRSRAEPTPRNA